jgi:3-hydroxyisobutyrate dehydrogenase
MKPSAAYFDLSTNSPKVVKKLHAAFAEKGLHMLDAPVSAGPSGAASRKLAIWVGGDESVFNQHKAVLDAIGDKAAYVGPIGSATVANAATPQANSAQTRLRGRTLGLLGDLECVIFKQRSRTFRC